MYQTSNEYKRLIDNDGRVTGIVGTLTLKNGEAILFDNDSIAKAPEINNQCSGDSELILGQAYQGQLKLSLYSDTDRYSVYGATISLRFQLLLEDDSIEEVPLGVYTVTECIRSNSDTLTITALDAITTLDRTYTDEVLSGTSYDILSGIKRLTGIELGQNAEDLASLPNGTMILGLPLNPEVNTYRDIVGDLAAVLGGFAMMDRTGKLVIKSFSKDIAKTINADYRNKSTISDFNLRYTKVSCVKQGVYFSRGNDLGQELALGENVFLQLGTDEGTLAILDNLLTVFGNYSYTPASFDYVGDPAIDMGDLIEITGYSAKTSTLVPVHKTTWKWRGYQKIEAVGKNPFLNSASKEDRATETQKKNIKTLENSVLSINNGQQVIIGDEWTELASTVFAMASDQSLLFNGVCKVDMVTAGNLRFKYSTNGIEHDFIHEVQTMDGVNTVTLFIPVKPKNNESNEFKVYISSDAIGSVETLDFRGALSGSGILTSDWSGIITIEDRVGRFRHGYAKLADVFEEYEVKLIPPTKAEFEEVCSPFAFSAHILENIYEKPPRIIAKAGVFTRKTEDGRTRLTEEGIIRTTYGGYIRNGG